MVEAITRSETTRGKSDEVVSRLSWHRERMKLPTSGYAAILKRLADKRNNLVHRGIHDITHDDVMFMKFFGDIVLVWLLGVYTSLPTKTHLDEFYRLRSQGKYSVRAAKETAQYLEDFTQAE